MRQPSEDRALYYRQLRRTIHTLFLPELTSPLAIDAAGLVDRILAEFIVEEECGSALSAAFGASFGEVLHPDGAPTPPVSADGFTELRAQAASEVALAMGGADEERRARARRLVAIERDFLERVEELRRAVLADDLVDDEPQPAGGCSVTAEQVTTYLRRRLSASPEVVVERLAVVPGGRSKETILVTVSGTAELPAELILRKDRPVGLLQTKAAEEFSVIKAVHDFGGIPVPEPYLAEWEGSELGEGTFLVMARVPGHKAGEFFPDLSAPTAHQAELGQQVAASLARLHALPLDRLEGTTLDVTGAAVTEASVSAMVDAIARRIDELSGPASPTVPLARQFLQERVSDVVPAPRLCLLQGDFGFHNMLIDGARVTALVDWEAATIGPPARELAAAWAVANALMPWADFIAAYLRAGGHPEDTDPRAIRYYRVLLALGGYMTSRMGGHLFRTGTKRDLLTAHSGLDSSFRCSRNLARALHDATSFTE
jgi:aminoglycoside phosphotransferase (APT) family kinase protein